MKHRPFIFFLFWVLIVTPMGLSAQSAAEAELANQYFQDSEYEAALDLYEKLHRKEQDNALYILRITSCYKELFRYEEGIDFLQKATKRNPYAFTYEFLKADLMERNGQSEEARELVDEVIEKRLTREADFAQVGAFLYQNGRSETALRTYLQGRKKLKSRYIYGIEIAELYAQAGKYAEATEEFVAQYLVHPASLNTITVQILNLVTPESKEQVETVLLTAVQKNPNDLGLRNIIYEFYVLTENFYEAFVQVKSIDKVFRENGERIFNFALTMRNNKNYRLSNKALDYIIENHEQSPYFFRALMGKTVNNELQAFETIPLDTAAVREAVNSYDELFKNFGREARFFDAIYRKAKLAAFYLHEMEEAYQELEQITQRGIEARQKAEATLLMGDILLMQKEYNKAKLKYSEVAASFQDGQIGALAKYKEGQMSYFKGDFEIAQARLKTIKDNTSNDISNDAIKLFLLIQDNTGLDTSTVALEKFSQAQLMVFQLDYDNALALLDSILYEFPNHSLMDEIFWEKANIYLKKGEIETAIGYLDRITSQFPEDIWGDDALYTKARIFDYTLKDPEKAMQLYLDFLLKYDGSLYIVNVRKRILEMRKERL